MSKTGDAIREHHQELLDSLRRQARALADDHPDADPEALLAFLRRELLPHAYGEERHLYPVVDSLIKAHGRATQTMSIDHRTIEEYVQAIDRDVQQFMTVDESQRGALEEDLRRLAVQLEAIFALHLRKEEEAYLPLFEQHLTVDEQERALEGMHASLAELDVRRIVPPQRHGLIFETFERLSPGAAFVLINDHDPKPLYYQFKAERDGTFTWEYQEQGPSVWRVRIGKVA